MTTNKYVVGEDREGEMKEMLLEMLRNATILSVEHSREDIPITSFDQELPLLIRKSEETLTITFVAGETMPDFKMSKKKEKEERKTIEEMLVKKKSK